MRSVFPKDAITRWLEAILFVALALRFLAQFLYGLYSHAETWEYDQIARDLVAGHGYSFRFFGSDWLTFGFPAFPGTLALLHVLGGGPNAYWLIGIAIALASAGTVWVGYAIASRLFDRTTGLVAAALVALNPALILFAARVHELNVDALLAGLVLVAVLDQARVRSSTGRRLGVLTGIATFARPTIVVFAFASLGLLGLRGLLKRAPLRPVLITGTIAIALALPWTVRNAVVLGAPSLSSPYNCITVWMGNNPNSAGGAVTTDGRSVFDVMPAELRARLTGQPEDVQGRIYCEEASAFLRASPLSGLQWWGQKFVYFWWFAPEAGLLYPKGWLDLYRFGWAAEVVLILLGTIAAWRRAPRFAFGIVALQLLIISVSQSFGYVEGRHRLLIEPTLSALAGGGIVFFVRNVGIRKRRVEVTP